MGVNGGIPHTFEQLTDKKPIISYPDNILENISILTADDSDNIIPVGSTIYRSFKYPGDLDLRENYIECCSPYDVIKKFSNVLINLVSRIMELKNYYVVEIKAGVDNRYDIDIGICKNGFYEPSPELINITNSYFDEGLLNKNEYDLLILTLNQKNQLTDDDYDLVKFVWRERKILRWTDKEIIKGFKILPMGRKIHLEQSLLDKSVVKIDIVTIINGRFMEASNIFTLGYYNNDGIPIAINFCDNILDNKVAYQKFNEELKSEIEKLYYSDLYYSPFKMVKRIWSYSRAFNDKQAIYDLENLISGDLSLAYSLTSELEAISAVVKKIRRKTKSMDKSLDQIKWKLTNSLNFTQKEIEYVSNKINEAKNINNINDFSNSIKYVKKFIKDIINNDTIYSLQNIGYNPPPDRFLPDDKTYNTYKIREYIKRE